MLTYFYAACFVVFIVLEVLTLLSNRKLRRTYEAHGRKLEAFTATMARVDTVMSPITITTTTGSFDALPLKRAIARGAEHVASKGQG